MKFKDHIVNLQAALNNPQTLTDVQANQIKMLLERLLLFEESKKKRIKQCEEKILNLRDKILYLTRIKNIAHDLYWGYGDQSSNWELLINQIELYK